MKGRVVERAILDCSLVDRLFVRTCDGLQAVVCSLLLANVSGAGTGAKTEGWWGGERYRHPPPSQNAGAWHWLLRAGIPVLFTHTHLHTDLQPLFPERQESRLASCDSPLSCGHFLVFGCRYWPLTSYTAALRGSYDFTTDEISSGVCRTVYTVIRC